MIAQCTPTWGDQAEHQANLHDLDLIARRPVFILQPLQISVYSVEVEVTR